MANVQVDYVLVIIALSGIAMSEIHYRFAVEHCYIIVRISPAERQVVIGIPSPQYSARRIKLDDSVVKCASAGAAL